MHSKLELIKLLEINIKDLDKAAKVLEISYLECTNIDLSENISEASHETLRSLEALSSRFSRLADILSKKSIRIIDEIELTDEGYLIDRLNRAEKRGIISSNEDFRKIRELRNVVAHDYQNQNLASIYSGIMQHCPMLIESVTKFKNYSQKYLG